MKQHKIINTIHTLAILAGLFGFMALGNAQAQTYRDRDNDGLIEIYNIEQLDSIRYNLTGTCSGSTCNGYELTRNLDFNSASSYRSEIVNPAFTTGSGWNPIGTSISVFFNATFEGNSYTIDHLYINRTSTNLIGLFGRTGSNSRIRNIGLRNVSVSGSSSVGGLVGYNYGVISQSYATGSVSGILEIGGLVGLNYGTISQSSAMGYVRGIGEIGGLVGTSYGTIIQSYATGSVSGDNYVGGLVGLNNSATILHGSWNVDATQTVGGTARGTNNKLGIGISEGSTISHYVSSLTLSALQSPTGTAADSIRELGPGFVYRQGFLPAIDKGARVTINSVNFTQTAPSITNIATTSIVASIIQGTATTRATLTVDGIAFTANVIGTTNITNPYTITNIQNGTGRGIVGKYQSETGITFAPIGAKTFGDAPFVLSASSSATTPIVFLTSSTIVSISTNTVTIHGGGIVHITAYTENDTLVRFTTQILTIDIIVQSISFGTLANRTFGDAPFVLTATSSANVPVLYSASSPLVSISNNTVTLNGIGMVIITAYLPSNNYTNRSVKQTFTIAPNLFYRDRDGDGLIEISNIEQLDSIQYNLMGICASGACNGYELTRSLDFNNPSSYRSGTVNTAFTSGSGWDPIGTLSVVSFNATFEGNGFTIDHLYINRTSTNYVGLFGFTESNSRIRNIGLTNVSVTGNDYVGGLVGYNYGTISQSHSTGSVRGNSLVGGLVGWSSAGTIIQSSATGYVTGNGNVGGLVGQSIGGTIIQSHATVSVMGSVAGNRYVGGLVGNDRYGSIIQSYATGAVTGTGTSTYGGVGGLVGINTCGTISQSYATGAVTGTGASGGFGGLVGVINSCNIGTTITQSYATGDVTGVSRVGGLIGSVQLLVLGGAVTIVQSYAIGDVTGTGTSSFVGGLVGFMRLNRETTIYHGYWNKDAAQTINGIARSNNATVGIVDTTGVGVVLHYVSGLTIPALQSPTGTAADSIQELGPGFVYRQGFLPAIDKGARVTIKGEHHFTQQIPTVTNINTSSTVVSVIQGTDTTRATITVDGIQFTANVIDTTSGRLEIPYVITNIQNGTGRGIIDKYNTVVHFTALGTKTYGDAPFVLSASSSSGLAVAFSASNTLLSIDNNTVTIRGAGTVNITAYSIENDTVDFAYQTQILSIQKITQSISFETLTNRTFGDAPFVLTASSSAHLPVLFSASNTIVSIKSDTVIIHGGGTVHITAYNNGNSNYLKADSVIQILTINKANQSISFATLPNKTFGDAPFVLTANSSAGLPVLFSVSSPLLTINNDTVTIHGAGTVHITAYNNGNSNYVKADSVIQILTINKANQSISFATLPNKTFGDAPFVLTASSSAGLPVLFSVSSPLLTINNDTVTIHGAGTVHITAYNNGNSNYLKADSVIQILTINKANQSISFATLPNKTFGDAPFVLTASSSAGLPVLFSVSSPLLTINNDTVTIHGAGTVHITAYNNGNSNYVKADSVIQILTINKANQSISFATLPNKTFGDAPFVLTANSSADLPVLFSVSSPLLTINNDTVTIHGAGTVHITAYNNGNSNYLKADSVIQILTINKANQSISFATLPNKTFGDAPFVLTASSSAGLPVLFSVSSPLLTINNDTVTIHGAGTVHITAYNNGNSNYVKADSVIQILTINKANQSISFATLPNKTFGDAPFVLTANSSAGLPLLFSVSSPLLTINNDTVTIHGAGTVSITAYNNGNSNYVKADSVIQILTINKANQSISFATLPNKTFGDAPFVLTANSSAHLPVLFSASNTIVSIKSDTVIIHGGGTVHITAYNNGNSNYLKADSVIQILTINKANQSISFATLPNKTFGDAPFVLTANSSAGLPVLFSVSSPLLTINNDTVTIHGAGTVDITAYQTGNENYESANAVFQILTIQKRYQSIGFGILSTRTFGQAPFVLSASSSSGLSLVYSASSNLISINNTTVTIRGAGTVKITATQTGNENYESANAVSQILSIQKGNQSITFGALANRTFGDTPFVLSATSSVDLGVVFSASSTLISINSNTVTINGAGTVNITAYSENDTLFGFTTQILTIQKRYQSIGFGTLANKTFGDAPFVLTANSSAGLPVLFSVSSPLLTINNDTVTIHGAGTVDITATQTGNENYESANAVFQILTIQKRYQSIGFGILSTRTFGQAPFVLSASSSAGVSLVYSASNTLISINSNTVTINGAGTVNITASNTGNNNYLGAFATQILTITEANNPNKTNPTLTFTAIPNLSIGQRYVMTATSNSAAAIVFTSSNERIATLSGNTLTALGTGTAVIIASQEGNAQYNPATAQQTVTVVATTTPTIYPLTPIEKRNPAIHIYPNPANDYITIQYDKTQKVVSVKVYDMTGKSYELGIRNYELGLKVDLKTLPKGEYSIILYGEKGEVWKAEKVIKE